MSKSYTVSEVAAAMNVNNETVRRWIREGRLKCSDRTVGRRGNRILESDLNSFQNDRCAKRPEWREKLNEVGEEIDDNDDVDMLALDARIAKLELQVNLFSAELEYLKRVKNVLEGS